MSRTIGRSLLAVGATCFVILAYGLTALHLDLPGSEFCRSVYGQPHGRRGPWAVYVLLFGGLYSLWQGLRLLGISDDGQD